MMYNEVTASSLVKVNMQVRGAVLLRSALKNLTISLSLFRARLLRRGWRWKVWIAHAENLEIPY